MFQEAIARYLQSSGHSQIQLKSVLFDMDGVLFNSMPYHADAWHKVMERHDLHLSREEPFVYVGKWIVAVSPDVVTTLTDISGNTVKMPPLK